MKENQISNWCKEIVRCIGILLVGYLFLQGLFTICCIQQGLEKTHYVANNIWTQIGGILGFLLLMRILWSAKIKEFLQKHGTVLVAAVLVAVMAFLIFWMSQTQFWYANDMEQIYFCVTEILQGDFSSYEPGGYLYMWPHQNGLFLLVYFMLSFLSQGQSFTVMYVLNAVFYIITILALVWSLKMLYKEKAVYSLQSILLLCYLPYGFFCVMMYSNVISFGWGCLSIALTLWYCQKQHWGKIIGAAVCMGLAIITKQNQLILFVGVLIVLVFHLLNTREKKVKPLAGVLVYAAIVILAIQLPGVAVERITGIEVGPGNSKWAHIVMGVREAEVTPGWYNDYNRKIFMENNYDHDATEVAAKAETLEIMKSYMEEPSRGWRFFNYKVASEWSNPTFECFVIQNGRGTSLELSGMVKSTINDGGKINLIFIYLFDIFQSIVLFGVLIYLINEENISWNKLLFTILFIGGFLFYSFWEAKSQYVIYYYFLLIPYCIPGYLKILEKGSLKKKSWNRLHTSLVIIVALIIIIGLSDAQWIADSFKIHVNTQDYYDYIHQYNQNFMNLRF